MLKKNFPPPIAITMVSSLVQKGFTLIEVMIALAIVSIALAALTQSMGATVLNQSQLETRVMASWVAQDELVKQFALAGKSQPSAEQKKQVEQLGRDWVLAFRTESTSVPGVKKLLVTVTDGQDVSATVRLVTVVGD